LLKHPSRKDLDRFLQSALPPARRRLVTRHLMRCESCLAYIGPSLEVMIAPEKVDNESPIETGDVYDAALDRAFKKALDRTGTVRVQRERAAPVIADLVQGRRKFRDLSEEEHDALQGIPKVDLLLEEAKALRHEEPAKMIEAADLARKAAMRLDSRVYGPHIVADTRAHALAELANAYRTADRVSSAEETMAQALHYLERGSGDLYLVARISELASSLACDQRHFHEAHELIDRALLIHRQLGDEHMAGRALIKKSYYLSCEGNPEEALIHVTEGFTLLDLKRDLGLGASALQNTILYAVDAGHLKKAQHHLWNAQNHGLLPDEEVNRIKLRATAGEIFAGLGQLERAEKAFRTAKADFEDLGLIYVAGITGIDLAAVWMRQGRVEEVKELAEKLADDFLSLNVKREALAAVLVLREACRKDRVTVEAIQKIAAYLRDLDRRPGGALPPPALADL
jgi:tetratricopeptide (TPR) repeat protein